MEEVMRSVIAAITAGAAEGAAALRRSGVAVELDIFCVEARVDSNPTASVRLDFVVPASDRPGEGPGAGSAIVREASPVCPEIRIRSGREEVRGS